MNTGGIQELNVDMKRWERHINSIVLNDYKDHFGGLVADIGCNAGYMSIIASRTLEKAIMIYGIDNNYQAMEAAMQLYLNHPVEREKVRFITSRIETLGKKKNFFDGAFMFQVLEHIKEEETQPFLAAIKRLIRQGGKLLLTVPFERAYDCKGHKQYFNIETLSELMAENGFRVIECVRDERKDGNNEQHNRINCLCEVIK